MSCNSLPSATTTLSEVEFEQIALYWLYGLGWTVDHGRTTSSKRQPSNVPASSFWYNACIAALAHRILFLHFAQGSKTDALCH